MNKFSKKKNRLLIELVKKNPVLYDPNDTNFKNCLMKLRVWENISSIMNIPVTDLKRRWKHFRDHFHKKQKAENAGLPTSQKWDYKPYLQFLAQYSNYKDKIKNNRDDTNEIDEGQDFKTEVEISVENETVEDSSSEDSDKEGIFEESKGDSGDAFDVNERNEIKEVKPGKDPLGLIHYEVLESEAVQERIPKKKRKKMDAMAALLENRLAKRFRFETSKSDISPTHKFFESMADIVAQFPPQLVAETRLKICQLVNEMEMKKLREQEFL